MERAVPLKRLEFFSFLKRESCTRRHVSLITLFLSYFIIHPRDLGDGLKVQSADIPHVMGNNRSPPYRDGPTLCQAGETPTSHFFLWEFPKWHTIFAGEPSFAGQLNIFFFFLKERFFLSRPTKNKQIMFHSFLQIYFW